MLKRNRYMERALVDDGSVMDLLTHTPAMNSKSWAFSSLLPSPHTPLSINLFFGDMNYALPCLSPFSHTSRFLAGINTTLVRLKRHHWKKNKAIIMSERHVRVLQSNYSTAPKRGRGRYCTEVHARRGLVDP